MSFRTRRFCQILASIAILATVIAYAFDAGSLAHSQIDISSDASPVIIPFGNNAYKIPRNYLVAVTQPTSTNPKASFTLYVLLPDLTPRTPATAKALDQVGWHDQLRALVEYGSAPRPAEDLLKFYLQISKTAEDDFTLVGGKYRLYKRPQNVPHEIYTTDTPHGLLLFTCSNRNDYNLVVYPSCSVTESIGNNAGLTFDFSRDYLLQTAEIDHRLRDLLTSFAKM